MKAFGHICFISLFLYSVSSFGADSHYELIREEGKFVARVTDKDDSERVLKISSENRNIKFFRKGDEISFVVYNNINMRPCYAYVQSVEKEHIAVQVKNFSACWDSKRYFLRGTMLKVEAPILPQRMIEVAQYRNILLKKKTDFLTQLNDANNFVWNFDQIKAELATDYDQRINQLIKEKNQAIKDLNGKRLDQLTLQIKLNDELNKAEHELQFYRLEKQELFYDKWNQDHDLGHPLVQRPTKTPVVTE